MIIEHDIETILKADYVIDVGPGAGDLAEKLLPTERLSQLKKMNPH